MDLHHLLLAGLPAHSGLPLSTDILGCRRHVSKVPNPEVPTELDDLVGAVHQQKRHLQTQCAGGLEIVDPAKFCRLAEWQVNSLAASPAPSWPTEWCVVADR
jgi:hypothetical protein